MEKYKIVGGKKLSGEVFISGAKNSVVALIPATILANGVSQLDNVPDIEDVRLMLQILEDLGATVDKIDKNSYKIDTTNVKPAPIGDDAAKMRASVYFMGALFGRFGEFAVPPAGGDKIGERPIDLHRKSFELLGAEVDEDAIIGGKNYVVATTRDEILPDKISIKFPKVSVGATINTILAAVLCDGKVIELINPAKEPHIIDVVNYLNCCGAQIRGAGTGKITIVGVKSLRGCIHSVIPDQIESGTYMLACAICGGDIYVRNVIPKHLEQISLKLAECGVFVDSLGDSIHVHTEGRPRSCDIITAPYPGFPTDMQAFFGVLLTVATGSGIITETIWNNRFGYVFELKKMGANILLPLGNSFAVFCEIENSLHGANLEALDIRAGAALAIAGLAAQGETIISDIRHIDRGYEDFAGKLRQLGADIERIDI